MSSFFLCSFHEIPSGFGPNETPALWLDRRCNFRLSLYAKEQIQICLTLFQHSLHTSGHRQEGAAHLEFAGEEESEGRPPLLTSCTPAALTTTACWIIMTQLTTAAPVAHQRTATTFPNISICLHSLSFCCETKAHLFQLFSQLVSDLLQGGEVSAGPHTSVWRGVWQTREQLVEAGFCLLMTHCS